MLGTKNSDMIIFDTHSVLLNELNPVLIARLESDHFAVLTKTENITEEKMNHICHQSYIYGTKRLSYIIHCGIYNIIDPTKKIPYMLDQAKIAEESISDQAIPYAIYDENLNPCSVNLSRVDLYDTNLLDFLKQQLQSEENVANIIKLEITESAYVTLESGAVAFLDEMKKINLSVLLDDFGNGMSSLSTLELYDFDIIKLDM